MARTSSRSKTPRERKRRTEEELIADLEAELASLEARLSKRRDHSPDRLTRHRERLRLSAEDYGLLVGVSAQTIYSWEKGRSKPRERQLEALESISLLDRKAAWARLDSMGH